MRPLFKKKDAKMGDFWDWGTAGIPLIGSKARTKKAIKQQEKSQKALNEHSAELNYRYGEYAADNALGRYKESADYDHGIWEKQFKTTSEAEKQQNIDQYSQAVKGVEKAGLSYGVLAGGIGGGGTAGAGGGGGTPILGSGSGNQKAQSRAAEAQQAEIEKQRALREGLLVRSEVENNKAEKLRAEAEARNINEQTDNNIRNREIENETSKATLREITETTNDRYIAREGQRLQNEFDLVRNEVNEATKTHQIKTIERQYEYLGESINEAIRNNEIGEEIRTAVINTYKQQLNNLIADEVQTYAKTELTQRQREEIGEKLQLATKGHELNVQEFEFQMEALGIQLQENAKDRLHSTGKSVIQQLGVAAAAAGGIAGKAGQKINEKKK